MIVRTKLMDDLIAASVADGCDRVLNLAAGFDTRPYRMTLPDSLEWVEADLAPLIDEKEKLLEKEKARCRLRRERSTSATRRPAALSSVRPRAGSKVLVVTEGLLMYLDDDEVRISAATSPRSPAFAGRSPTLRLRPFAGC